MNNTECLAVIPYVGPEVKKTSFLGTIFKKRKKLYIVYFTLFFITFLIGFTINKNYTQQLDSQKIFNEISRTFGTFEPLSAVKYYKDIIFYSICVFISAFTIFSPVFSIAYVSIVSIYAGYQLNILYTYMKISEASLFFLFTAIFIFISIAYSIEIFININNSTKGIKYMLNKKSIMPIVLKMMIYLTLVISLIILLNYIYSKIMIGV